MLTAIIIVIITLFLVCIFTPMGRIILEFIAEIITDIFD